jgi:hypothetical protein
MDFFLLFTERRTILYRSKVLGGGEGCNCNVIIVIVVFRRGRCGWKRLRYREEVGIAVSLFLIMSALDICEP